MATKPLTYRHEVDGVLTDLDSLPLFRSEDGTYGVRASGTLVNVVEPETLPDTLWTQTATGVYEAEIPGLTEGVEYEYAIRIEDDGVIEYLPGDFTATADADAGAHYAERVDIEREIGKDNTLLYADPQSNQLPADVDATIEDSLDFADDFIDARLGGAGYTLPLVALTGKSIPTALLRTIARKLAAWQLYQIRGMGDDKLDGKFQVKYDWAVAELQQLIDDGLVGVAEQGEDLSPPAGTFGFVTINRRECVAVTDENSN